MDSSSHPHEFSPQPQGDEHPCSREDLSGGDVRAEREFSDSEQNGVDDFGDFQGGCVGVEKSYAQESLGGFEDTANQDKSDGQISSQMLSQESENSKCEEIDPARHRTNFSPPPLDCVAESTVVEDGFPSSFFPPDNEDADFGDFASHEATFDPSSNTNHLSDRSFHTHELQSSAKETIPESDNGEMASSVVQQASYVGRLENTSPQDKDLICKPDRNAKGEVKDVGNFEHLRESFASPPEETPSPLSNKGIQQGTADGMSTTHGDVEESTRESKEFESTARVSDGDIDEGRIRNRGGLENISPSPSDMESAVLESAGPVERSDKMVEESEQEVGPSNDGDVTEHFGVCGSDKESDFGDFNQANDDEDDLDFADLRKQAESNSYDDFGDFNCEFAENNGDGIGSVERGHDKDSDDFGDFAASTDTEDKAEFGNFGDFTAAAETDGKVEFGDFGDFTASGGTEDNVEFGDFGDFTASADTEDKVEFGDFGDFEGHAEEAEANDIQDFEDGFGNFSAPKSSGEFQESSTGGVAEETHFLPSDDGVKRSPVLQKVRKFSSPVQYSFMFLEELIMKNCMNSYVSS